MPPKNIYQVRMQGAIVAYFFFLRMLRFKIRDLGGWIQAIKNNVNLLIYF